MAPAFNRACSGLLAPGIGSAPLQSIQFRATWDAVFPRESAIRFKASSNGCIWVR